METLKKFWHWADNERPSRDVFDVKATAGGPLSEEAQEALQQAVEVVGLRAPDVLHPSGEVLRPAIKLLSLAILEAWQMLKDDEQIQTALDVQKHGLLKSDPNYETKLRLYAAPLQAFREASAVGPLGDAVWLPMDINTYADPPVRQPIKDEQRTPAMKNADLARSYGMGPQKLASAAADYVAHSSYIPREFFHSELSPARHNTGAAADLKMVPAIGELGVTRNSEHERVQVNLLERLIGLQAFEHVSVRVDSRGVLFYSREFEDICGLVQESLLETSAGNGDIDGHKVYMIVNDLRLRVVDRKRTGGVKTPGMRTFPGAQNMFTGK